MLLSALIGNLIGIMLDPLIWGVVLIVAYVLRRLEWYQKAAAATGIVLVISIAVIFSSRINDASNGRVLMLTVVGTLIWSFIVSGIVALRKWTAPHK